MEGAQTEDLSLTGIPREQTIFSELKSRELSDLPDGVGDEETYLKLEELLTSRIESGDKLAGFLLGQLYFEEEKYQDSRRHFKEAVDAFDDLQSKFQLSVMKYDGLGCKPNQAKGVELMKEIVEQVSEDPENKHLLYAAAYNIGLAYLQGFGVKQSSLETEKWWLLASNDGDPRASISAQVSLGHFYCERDNLDLSKAFFWFSEACGNGSLEAQGALGVMYLSGLGCEKNPVAAFECLREAAERGNIYAMGNLVQYYYLRRFYTKTTQLAAKLSQVEDVEEVARQTECLAGYIRKGLSLSSFIMGRCLQQGLGVQKDDAEAKNYFSKSFAYDPDMCAKLQNCVLRSEL